MKTISISKMGNFFDPYEDEGTICANIKYSNILLDSDCYEEEFLSMENFANTIYPINRSICREERKWKKKTHCTLINSFHAYFEIKNNIILNKDIL